MTTVARLRRIALNVADLFVSARFFQDALGFEAEPGREAGAETCRLFGVRGLRTLRLRLGAQEIELAQFDPPGQPYPPGATAADLVFQHFAIVTPDIAASYRRLSPLLPAAISRDGPVHLPYRSGGVTAYKFRDPDGHPLELIQFPQPRPPGIDHSALSVAQVERSIAFYAALGFATISRQVNTGAEQDRLDGLDGAVVDVVALAPRADTPHVELLGYRHPAGRPAGEDGPTAIAATRLMLECSDNGATEHRLLRDADGHYLLLTDARA